MGKRLGTATTATSSGGNITTIKGGISCFDWVDLCQRWNAPVSKSDATVLYETYFESKARQQQQPQQHNTAIQLEDLNFLDIVQLYSVLNNGAPNHVGMHRLGLRPWIRVPKCSNEWSIIQSSRRHRPLRQTTMHRNHLPYHISIHGPRRREPS